MFLDVNAASYSVGLSAVVMNHFAVLIIMQGMPKIK
jgi:hypothetical protein